MLNIVSLIIGAVAFVIAVFALIPFVGWANWFVIPLAGFGLLLGLLARGREGQILNLVVMAIALVRLSVGGGIV
jgi:hypothetical protein